MLKWLWRTLSRRQSGEQQTEKKEEKFSMISPTGAGPRGVDSWGSGAFRAPRGDREHKGVDYRLQPGQVVVAPISGTIVRHARPYSDPKWLYEYNGVVLKGERCSIKMFYLEPFQHVIGKKVRRGEAIGMAQDVGKKYPGITLHVHLQIDEIDPELFMERKEGVE